MTVKLKVKHIVYSVLVFAAALAILVIVIQPQIAHWQIDRLISSGGHEEGRERILDRIDQGQTGYLELIETYMIEPIQVSREDIQVGPSVTSVSDGYSNLVFTREETLPYLTRYLEEGDDPSMIQDAGLLLMAHHAVEQDIGLVEDTADKTVAALPHHQHFHESIFIEEARLLMDLNELALAEDKLIAIEETERDVFSAILLQTAELRARLLQQQGEVEEAIALLEERLTSYEEKHESMESELAADNPDYEPQGVERVVYFEEAARLKEQLERMDSDRDMATVTGQVKRSDGEPMAHATVYLRDASRVNQSISSTDQFRTTTDAEGYYQFEGVIPDTYQIHLGLSFEQVDGFAWPVPQGDWIDAEGGEDATYDITFSPLMETRSPVNHETVEGQEITFDWEPVEEADSYALQLMVHYDQGSFGQTVASGLTDASHTMSLEELYAQDYGVVYDPVEEDKDFFHPENILAFRYPDGEFSWQVTAFNEDDEPIAQSNGYRLQEDTVGALPFFHLDGPELSEADQILFDEDLKGAIEAYETSVQEDPEDVHSLRMLTRLNGFSEEHEPETMAYREQLQDAAPSTENAAQLFGYALDQRNMDDASHWKDAYLALSEEEETNHYMNGRFGLLRAYQGDYEDALARLSQSVETGSNNRYTGAWTVVQLAAGEELDLVLENARSYPERSTTGEPAERWARHLEAVEELDPEVIHSAAQAMLDLDDGAMDDIKQDHPPLSALINAWQEKDW
ncbi:carboxypeptidase-like regulatory domain-containing protein [Salisediminibacterium beveridgei]|uniref:Carboxypeptidase regulatory-like domain-containing protein n=1 Tax=Salisediminibacterium beveridgei TaxID=632773 RepID=A0A1D7QZ12_9BACI|nr:carboxypeptidase-like regulatory domain-containing protein [Salisediminibacterium beveridgei]AOM84256.1 hypothetical protein BBEV_2931 [Salisediminibacterium beveridgei]